MIDNKNPRPWAVGQWLYGHTKSALVTGSAGVVGRHMVAKLRESGYAVKELDLKTGQDCLDYFRSSWHSYDLIVHCAYNVGGRESIDGVNMNLSKNLILDAEMFNYALRTGAGHVLYFSSSAAYPTFLQTNAWCGVPLLEDDMDGANPDAGYGLAKVAGEGLAVQVRRMGLSVSVVRPFSGYGSDQDDCYPFPSIVKRAMSGDFTVWGPPEQTRDWINISDIVEACMEMIENKIPGPVNLCTGVGTTMGDLLRLARFLYNQEVISEDDIFFDLSKPTGVIHRVGDPERLNLFFKAKVSLARGILEAIEKYESLE